VKNKRRSSKKTASRSSKVIKLAEVLSSSQWHSCLSFDSVIASNQHRKLSMPNTEDNLLQFVFAGNIKTASNNRRGQAGQLLIRKTDRALWKVSDDGHCIEPAFTDDIITVGDDQ